MSEHQLKARAGFRDIADTPRPGIRDAAERARRIRADMPSNEEMTDRFFVDKGAVPEGWSYEWKRKALLGKEDPSYDVQVARAGWEPVPSDRHPGMLTELDGMVLMERPQVVTDDAHNRNYAAAKSAVAQKENQLSDSPGGTLPRKVLKVGHSYEAGIPLE